MKRFASAALVAAVIAGSAGADPIAREDFDGGAVGLISGFVPGNDNLDGGGGDWFGVGSIAAWPQATGMPFSLADDSVFSVSTNGVDLPFVGDGEGVYGQNANRFNKFFGVADTREWGTPTASWTFDIAGASDLSVLIDIAADIDAVFGYDQTTQITFTAQIDAGPVQTLFDFTPDGNFLAAGAMRQMDSGASPDPDEILFTTGDATITKHRAGGASTSFPANLYLDKSLPDTGEIDTFETTVAGTGNELTITVSANLPFEALAFDNIVINGVLASVPGDANGDGFVDTLDIQALVSNWDPNATDHTLAQGDFNGDGATDTQDIQVLIANWSPAVNAPAPEPASLGLLALGGLLVARRRRG